MRPRPWRLLVPIAALAATAVTPPSAGLARVDGESEIQSSLLGNYLAGRFARSQHETGDAAGFYRQALLRDPGSEVLLEQSFLTEAAEGNWPQAVALAHELSAKPDPNRMALVLLGLSEFKAGRHDKADAYMAAASSGAIGELTSVLARAWIRLESGKPDAALELIDIQKQPEWAQDYTRYHRALLIDLAGRHAEARALFDRVWRRDTRSLRTSLAYASHASNAGDFKLATAVLDGYQASSQTEAHPLAAALRARLAAREKVELLIPGASQGLAEVFYGLGEALTGEGGVSVGVLYLQMALYLDERHPFALIALAQAHEASKRFTEANAVYDRIAADSPLHASIEVQKALNLAAQDKMHDAQTLLERLAARSPSDIKAFDALGTIMRSRKQYKEAAGYYTRAIALIDKVEKRHWAYFYARGTCHERTGDWQAAEADFKKALRLSPDQPMVLNYLGYSWIDQNRNLKQGLALIEKAVGLKPDDGYIVDSLGWAHFKLRNFKIAVRHLERAVELKPDDSVLNDHLGDALWRVGREREARFQWDQALTLDPEPENAEKIRLKIAKGLAAPPREPARQAVRLDPAKKRVETKLAPSRRNIQ